MGAIADCALPATVNRIHANGHQPESGHGINIHEALAGIAGHGYKRICGCHRRRAGTFSCRQKRSAHLVTDFKTAGSDCRTQPGHQPGFMTAHGNDGVFQYTVQQPAPAGMHRRCHATITAAQEHRQAVSLVPVATVMARVPWTCSNHCRRCTSGSAWRSRRRLPATAAPLSPTWVPRFRLS